MESLSYQSKNKMMQKRNRVDQMTVREEKIINYLAITLCCSVCLQRLSTVVGNVFFILAILLGLFLLYQRKKAGMPFFQVDEGIKGYYKALGIFVLSMVPSALFTGDVSGGVGFVLEKWVYRWFPFFAITLFIRDKQILKKMLLAYMVAIGLDCLVAIGQSLILDLRRPYGFGGHPLHLATILSFFIPILMVAALDGRVSGKLKIVVIIVLICCLAGALVGNSRGAWLTLFVVVPMVAWPYIKCNKKYLCVAGLICCLLVGFFASNPTYQHRLMSITNTTTNRSNADRILMWKSARDMMIDRPAVGVGPGNFKEMYEKEYKYPEITQNLNHAHNNYLQIGAEYGLIGLGGFFYCLFYMLRRNYYETRSGNLYARMRLGFLLGFLFFGIIEYSLNIAVVNRALSFLLAILLMLEVTSAKDNMKT